MLSFYKFCRTVEMCEPKMPDGEENNILDTWLLANTDVESGDKIVLKHWW